MNVFVIIPAYNEKTYLGRVLEKVLAVTQNVIVVDDGSRDGSTEIARQSVPHLLVHKVNLGKGAAMKTGCEYAFKKLGAEAVIFLDADDQHDPTEIPAFVAALEEGNEVVFGCRTLTEGMPIARLLGNKVASWFLRVVMGAFIPDIPSGFKALTKKAYERVKWQSQGYEVETEISARVGMHKIPYAVIPIRTIYHDRNKGMSVFEALRIGAHLPLWKIRK